MANPLVGYGRRRSRHDDYLITRSDEREFEQVMQSSFNPSRARGRTDSSRGNIVLALQIETTDMGKTAIILSAILNLQVSDVSPVKRADSLFSNYHI